MNAECFLDTNVFLYAFDRGAAAKRARAGELIGDGLRSGCAVISWQVCQEFLHAALHKPTTAVPPQLLADYLSHVLAPMCRVMPSPALYGNALRIHRETRFRFYDSLIVAAAIESGAPVLYSEDLQHDRWIGPLRIVDPFR